MDWSKFIHIITVCLRESICFGEGKESPVYFGYYGHTSEQISPIEVDLLSEIVSMDVLTYTLDEFQGILFLTRPSLFLWT